MADLSPPKINLLPVWDRMTEIRDLMRRLDNTAVLDISSGKASDTAAKLRDLRRLEDLFAGCKTMVNNEMWVARGYADMLGSDD